MTETELKPCPFCGGKAEFNGDVFGEGVECSFCGARIGNDIYGKHGIELAAKDWNARPIEDEKDAEIARLREALEEISRGFDSDSRDYNREQMMRIAKQALEGGNK